MVEQRYKNEEKYNSIREDYMTPAAIYQPLLDLFKRTEFDIDVCCTKHNIPAKQHFTKDIDGLSQQWGGLCFCNPPWKYTGAWMAKGAESLQTDPEFIGCYVIPSDRLYVKYMQKLILNNPQAVFAILPQKQGYIIPGAEDVPPVPSVGTIILILSNKAQEIAAELNKGNVYDATFFVGGARCLIQK